MESEAAAWVSAHVEPTGPIEIVHARPWATVSRVPVRDGVAWLKECGATQAFEPRLTAELFERWPDLATEVLAHDVDRSWLLLADAGTPVSALGNSPESWMAVLPQYAELQRGETPHVGEHVSSGVPDLRVDVLPERYEELLRRDLPVDAEEVAGLRRFAPRFTALCEELAAHGIPASVQHDDLHMNNLFVDGPSLRIIDWGDASIAHPFFSLVVTFRFLEEFNGLPAADPWFTRLRDAYLEPWGAAQAPAFDLALRVGAFARAFAEARVRDQLPSSALPAYDEDFRVVLRRALLLCGSSAL